MTLKESRDYKVRTAGVQVRTGRKRSASKAVSEAESRLRPKDIVGTVAVGRQGFGTSKSCYWKNGNTQERRSLVQREIKSRGEENRQAKTVELGSQGFVKEGEVGQKSKKNISGMVNQAKDWQLEVDLEKKMQFPDIVPTNLRPDMVLWSASSKKVVIIELTVPWEEI
ncbi:uncharacterized protein LOC143057392 [Mytilus galloprovincialis]|uniref:uncharacterized protein LOC143057392 n=1 Tax=Mytilus galloprovincialis TaxID=29158 RepID=UPI003F7B62A0